MLKLEYKRILEKYKVLLTEIYIKGKNIPIEYYTWYNMIISFSKNKNNNRIYVKFEGDIPIALLEYITKKYPTNDILYLYPRNKEDIKNCNTVLIHDLKDLSIFLEESSKFWQSIKKVEQEMILK